MKATARGAGSHAIVSAMRTSSAAPATVHPRWPAACLNHMVLAGVTLLVALAPGAHAEPRVGQAAPEITGQRWVNSAPMTIDGLRGRVLLVEFWTYG
jgi:hypothetical protein